MSHLETLANLSESIGFPPTNRVVDGPHPCPTHEVPLRTQQLEVFSGWYQLHVCPSSDGTCSYPPDGHPQKFEGPELDQPLQDDA